MKNFNSNKNSNEESDNNVFKDLSTSKEFCEVCFISFGSQEQRVFMDSKVAHIECGKKIRSN